MVLQLEKVSKEKTFLENEYQNKMEEFKNLLSVAQKQQEDIVCELDVEIAKTKELEAVVRELKKLCASFEDKLSKKSLQLEEAKKQIIDLENEPKAAFTNGRNYGGNMHFDHEIGLSLPNDMLSTFHSIEKVCTREADLIANLEKIKFLCCCKLIEKKDIAYTWKIFLSIRQQLQQIQLLKKFMSYAQNIMKTTISASKLYEKNNQLPAVLPQEFNLVHDLFYKQSVTLKEVLSVVLQENRGVTLKTTTIHVNHLPVITSTRFVLYHHRMSNTFVNVVVGAKLQRENRFKVVSLQREMKNVVDVLKVQDVPSFMNYVVALTDYIQKQSSIGQYLEKSGFDSTLMLRLFEQYLAECLNPGNATSLSVVNYWKNHCGVLGLSETDFEKIIPLFGFKDEVSQVVSEESTLEVKSPEKEVDVNEETKTALENLILEKEKQIKLLNNTIEEIENDLGETFQQKEDFKKMVLKTSEVLTQLKASIGTTNSFLSVNFENVSLDELCFCENCIEQVETEDIASHERLSLSSLFEYIGKLVQIGCQLEKEILNTKNEPDLTMKYKELQDRNSELEMALADSGASSKDTHDEIGSLKYELSKAKEDYDRIYQTADEKDVVILDLESTNSNLSDTVEEYRSKLEVCEKRVLELSTEIDCLKVTLLSKEEEIQFHTKTAEDDTLKCKNDQMKLKEYEDKILSLSDSISKLKEDKDCTLSLIQEKDTLIKTLQVQLKCKEYESKIEILNNAISKLKEEISHERHNSALQSTKNVTNELDDGRNPKETISELQCEVESLKKENTELNLAIETVRNELNTVVTEKQDIEESEKLNTELNNLLQEEITHAELKFDCERQELSSKLQEYQKLKVDSDGMINKLKIENERLDTDIKILKGILHDQEKANEKEELLSKLQECEKLKADSENAIDKLKLENERLEKDVRILKGVLREHEKANLDKNATLKTQNQTIEHLNKRICNIELENNNLKSQIKEDKENSLKNSEVENLNKQCSIYEEQIKRLQLVEEEKAMMEGNLQEIEIQRDDLIKQLEETNRLFKQFKKTEQELKSKNKEVDEALSNELVLRLSLEEKLDGQQHSMTQMNKQLEDLKMSSERLKSVNKENSKLKEKVVDLEREIKQRDGMIKRMREESIEQQLVTEKEELIAELTESRNSTAALDSELSSLKNSLSYAVQFIKVILDIVISTIGSYSDYPDVEGLKSNLVLLAYWKQGTQSMANVEEVFTDEVLQNLRRFYVAQATNHQEELAMKDHIKSIIDFVNDNFKSDEYSPPAYNFADVTNMSIFETTFAGDFDNLVNSPTTLKVELQQAKKLLEECFGSLKNTNRKLLEEIEELKKKFEELPSKNAACDCEASEKNNSYRTKLQMTLFQYKRLEKDFKKQADTMEELKEKINTLEKEKQDLEEEANELSDDVKRLEAQYSGSDELAETLTQMARTRQKLTVAEKEKNILQQLIAAEKEKNALKQKLVACQCKGDRKVLGGASNVLTGTKENVRRKDV